MQMQNNPCYGLPFFEYFCTFSFWLSFVFLHITSQCSHDPVSFSVEYYFSFSDNVYSYFFLCWSFWKPLWRWRLKNPVGFIGMWLQKQTFLLEEFVQERAGPEALTLAPVVENIIQFLSVWSGNALDSLCRYLQYLGAQIIDQAASAPLQSDPCTSRKQASIRLPREGSWPCLFRAWTSHSHHGKRLYSPKISNRRKKSTLFISQIKYLMINFLWHVYPVTTFASAPKLSKVNVITEISCHIS